MKITLNWLKQYVDFTGTPEDLAERLTMLGVEVEGIQKLGGEFEGIVVAQVITRDKHPNADKLSICRVNDGTGERQIVCGAQNFQAGDKVPLILPGAALPAKPGEAPFTIKVGKIRGVESQGMMCSPQELGLASDADGLLILDPAAKVGQPFAEHLGRSGSDVVYDLEITPNRPDLNSVIGIAREIAAVTGNSLRLPVIASLPQGEDVLGLAKITIEDPLLCPRYTARVIRGVKIGPSPAWLKSTLEKVGLRSLNNVVDITNFVLLEIGQPLHAFDFANLTDHTIVVRRATEGEKFTTLDGIERTLNSQNLLIADATRGVALAGVMGGLNSEISAQTVDVLLESATFQPQNIRATSKKLELRSDASYRFERGADIGICDWASRRATQLIVEIAGGTPVAGVIDLYPTPAAPKKIILRHGRTDALLGMPIDASVQDQFLRQLGLEVVPGTDSSEVTIPSFRIDLKSEIDLIEEVARIYGIDKIPSTPPRGAIGTHKYDQTYDHLNEVRRTLIALGLTEAQGQTLIGVESAKLAVIDPAQVQMLANPLSSDMDALRPSVLPGLIDSLSHNSRQFQTDTALFEIGRVFVKSGTTVTEELRLGIALTGRRSPIFWSGEERDASLDIYDLKGTLEELFDAIGLRGCSVTRREGLPAGLYLEAASIGLGKQTVGEFGQLIPALAKKADVRGAVFLAELNLGLILSRRNSARSFKALQAFPTIRRDIAMVVPETTSHEAVLNLTRQLKLANLDKVELFDIYRGQGVAEGAKSMAYAFTYRHAERTLTDTEVNAAHDKLVQELQGKIGATLR